MMSSSTNERLEDHLRAYHHALADWLSGRVHRSSHGQKSPLDESPLAKALHPSFTLVSAADGHISDRATLLTRLAEAYGSEDPAFQIDTTLEHAEALASDGGGQLLFVVFRERQGKPGEERDRRATALVHAEPDGRFVWRHVHETSIVER